MNKLLYAVLIALFSVAAIASPGQIHYVKNLQAKVYEDASESSNEKLTIAVGRKLMEFERKGNWVNVGIDKSGGIDGWVKLSDLSPVDPDGLKY